MGRTDVFEDEFRKVVIVWGQGESFFGVHPIQVCLAWRIANIFSVKNA